MLEVSSVGVRCYLFCLCTTIVYLVINSDDEDDDKDDVY